MALEDVYVVSDKLAVVTGDEVAMAETVLGTRFPDGYRDYVTNLGAGVCNDTVVVYMPSAVIAGRVEAQDIWAAFAPSRYHDGFDLLPLHRMVESINVMGTVDGDEVVFHPDTPNELYALPRHDGRIHKIGRTLDEAMSWLLDAGVVFQRDRTSVLSKAGQFVDRSVRYFKPDHDQEESSFLLPGIAYAEMQAFFVALAEALAGESMCVRHHMDMYTGGGESEWLQLFVKEYGGEVRCIPLYEGPKGAEVIVSYDDDAESRSVHLNRLLTYLQGRADSCGLAQG